MSPPPRRPSQADVERRDAEGFAARQQRDRQGVPVETFDDLTGRYEGEELARMRANRPTPMRLYLVEKKQDEDRADHKALVTKVDVIGKDVAGMRSALEASQAYVPELIKLLKDRADTAVTIAKDNNETKRLGMSNTNRVIMGVLALLTTILTGVLLGRA